MMNREEKNIYVYEHFSGDDPVMLGILNASMGGISNVRFEV